MEKRDDTFRYTYSAAQQQEIENIRKKYLPPEEDKMEQLRKLDASVTTKAMVYSLATGILGALILGTGMSLVMSELGNLLGALAMPVGVALGLIGLVLVALAYPLYNRTLKKERQRIAPLILQLTEELMQ